jgi:hypothetical protein
LTLRSWPSRAWILHWVPKYRTEEARASLRTKRKLYLYSSPSIIRPSQLSTPLESDPPCPSYIFWHVALGSHRGDPYKTRAATSQGVLHVDAIGTVDCTIYVNPYVSTISIRPASSMYFVHSCDTQLPVLLLCMAIMVTL